jgi:hypothetical protein
MICVLLKRFWLSPQRHKKHGDAGNRDAFKRLFDVDPDT